MTLSQHSIDVKEKHVYVTGGGGGLGLALLRKLVPLGANVSFVTKDVVKAAGVIASLEAARISPNQRVVAVAADLSDYTESQRALDEAIAAQDGVAPDWVFLTAGFAKPGSFLDHDPDTLKRSLDGVYWVHAWTVWVAAKAMAAQGKGGDIVFVSNILSETSWPGYSAGAPARYAVKGLYDTLVPELADQGIKPHLFLLSGQILGNYDHEREMKSDLTRKLDEDHGYLKLDEEVEAAKIIDSIERGVDGRV